MTIASTSLAAYRSLDLPELEAKVLAIIEGFGEDGCTPDEINDRHPEIEYRSLSPRFAPLERKCLIFKAGDTRLGKRGRHQKVLRSISYASVVPVTLTKPKKNPFLEGMIFAAKTILKQSDLVSAKRALKVEIERVLAK